MHPPISLTHERSEIRSYRCKTALVISLRELTSNVETADWYAEYKRMYGSKAITI
jgi:hypothetical protein